VSELIISVSGLRGIVGETLTPDVAVRFVAAFASKMPPGPIFVGRDGRSSGTMLSEAILSSLRASGRDCVDCDVIATPTLGVLVRDRSAAGAVQISASHNPPPYNGIKLFGPEGRVLDADRGAAIRDGYLNGEAAWCSFDQIGTLHPCHDVHQAHLDKVLATVNVEAIRAAKHRVLIDSNHGAGGILGKRLLDALGCEIIIVGETPDGHFAHVPEPTAENLQGIASRVKEENCSVGFCQDPDADRLALIDSDGRYIGEEFTVALCVQHALSKWKQAQASVNRSQTSAAIVINGATSGMSERLAADAGAHSYRSAVGEANVADKMIATKAIYGGEGNGGPIDPNVGYVRDSFVGMAQVLDLMTKTGKTLAQLADALPQLSIYKSKAEVSNERLPKLFESLIAAHPDASADTGDGLRLAWKEKWLLVRGSNTEPIVRFIAEATTMEEAKQLCESAAKLLG